MFATQATPLPSSPHHIRFATIGRAEGLSQWTRRGFPYSVSAPTAWSAPWAEMFARRSRALDRADLGHRRRVTIDLPSQLDASGSGPGGDLRASAPTTQNSISLVRIDELYRFPNPANMSQRRPSPRRRRDSSSSEAEAQPSQSQSQAVNLNLPRPKESARHLFLQSIISHRTMSHASAKAAYRECCRLCGGQFRGRGGVGSRLGRSVAGLTRLVRAGLGNCSQRRSRLSDLHYRVGAGNESVGAGDQDWY